MNKDSNNNRWPYQEFHDANKNKSNRMDDSNWSTHFHKYNKYGKTWKTEYKYGIGATSDPSSVLCEASAFGVGEKHFVVIKNL